MRHRNKSTVVSMVIGLTAMVNKAITDMYSRTDTSKPGPPPSTPDPCQSYLWLAASVVRWLARGEGMVGEEVARGEGPDHGGNLKFVLWPGRWGVHNSRGLGGGLRCADGLGCPQNLPLLETVLVGLDLWGDLSCLGDGGVVFEGEGSGASRGLHIGQEGDLNTSNNTLVHSISLICNKWYSHKEKGTVTRQVQQKLVINHPIRIRLYFDIKLHLKIKKNPFPIKKTSFKRVWCSGNYSKSRSTVHSQYLHTMFNPINLQSSKLQLSKSNPDHLDNKDQLWNHFTNQSTDDKLHRCVVWS